MEDANILVQLATFDQYRGLLFSIAHRMLGSVADAEDMLEETFIRWQQSAHQDIVVSNPDKLAHIPELATTTLEPIRVQGIGNEDGSKQ